jgi:prolyl-tRNA editing enzyme YbaK/EbsC (Cys-tRNA(Pro) deacylase)
VWPEAVERVAEVLRGMGVQAQLEELPAGVDEPPGPAVRVAGFECDGRTLVVLVPAERALDRDKLRAAARCTTLRPAPFPAFPFERARVLVDHSLLAVRTVWLEAGSPRHVLGLPPGQLTRVTRAETADVLLEDRFEGG